MLALKNSHRRIRFAVAIFALIATLCFSAAFSARAQPPSSDEAGTGSPAGDQLNKGLEAYRSARYTDAIAHFQKAVELDPASVTAKVYLATALAQTVVPGLDTPENLKTAELAIGIFREVLEKRPDDLNSMKQIAGIYFAVTDLEQARTWQKKVLDADPNDPEAAYTVGVIDWTVAHRNALKALTQAGLNDDGEGNASAPPQVLQTIKAANGALVSEALTYLNQAIENRPEYDDAMAYMNLVYRRKADVDWEDASARKDDLAQAEEWRNKAMTTRRQNEEKRLSGIEKTNN